jgi:hypothetical protein
MEVLRMLFELASTNFENISLMAYNCLRKKKCQKCPAPQPHFMKMENDSEKLG